MSTSDEDTSVLKLGEPAGTASKGNAAPGTPSIEDQIAASEQLSDLQKRIQELEKSNAGLETAIKRGEPQLAKSKGVGAGTTRHVAHAEGWRAICTAPDYCKVGKDIIAFNSFATLDTKVTASPNVQARGTAIYRKGDVIKNVQSDAGKHIVSGTSLGSGHVKILDGHESVKVNGLPVARHDSRCLINCDASGVGGAQGKLVTEQKSVGASGGSVAANPDAPPGKRTNAKLEALLSARAKIAGGMLDLNAIDEFVNFKESNRLLDRLIGEISGTPGTVSDYAAQAARGALGFAKDVAMGAGELAYEGIKAVPKLVQLTQTQSGQVLAQLDAQILAENIRLGNITPETMGRTALDVGKAVLKPVTDPWAKKQYVEAITRGAAEIATAGFGWLKGRKTTNTRKASGVASGSDVNVAASGYESNIVDAVKPKPSLSLLVDDGIHIRHGKRFFYLNKTRSISAVEANSGFERPPYNISTEVTEGALIQDEKLVRLYDGEISTDLGRWLMPESEIKGLSAIQIKEKFALPSTPKFIVDVNVPAGTVIRLGEAGSIPEWGSGGGVQIQLMERIPMSAYVNKRPFP